MAPFQLLTLGIGLLCARVCMAAVSPANLQLYALMGDYGPDFQAQQATVITGWNNRTVNISSELADAGLFGWPETAVKLCEAKCLEWSPCLSFDIDVVKEVCYLSATRSQPTHVNGNAALFVRVTDWLALKQNPGAVKGYVMAGGQVQTGYNDRTYNFTTQFDKNATTLANLCASQCSHWSLCRSFDFVWNKRLCYLSSNATAPRHDDPNAILFVRAGYKK